MRVSLPHHLRGLAQVAGEVQLELDGVVTAGAILDALESRYPALRGTIRDHATRERRPYLRYFACKEDFSHEPPDLPLPAAVAAGEEPFRVVGAIAGGREVREEQGMAAEQFDLGEAVRLLQATPGALQALLAGLPEGWLTFQEDPEAWSPRTVLVHFIHNERSNWIPRARVILSEDDEHKFPPFRQLPMEGEFEGVPVDQLFAQFTQLRQQNLATLTELSLEPGDYDREGEHPVLGTVKLRNLLATWVVHDLNHLHQIAKTLAKRHREAVGPWRSALGILDL